MGLLDKQHADDLQCSTCGLLCRVPVGNDWPKLREPRGEASERDSQGFPSRWPQRLQPNLQLSDRHSPVDLCWIGILNLAERLRPTWRPLD